MSVYCVDPCKDVRWRRFIEARPDASVFHTPGWLEALRRTYRYESVVYTTSSPGEEIVNGQAFCRVNSWLTGRRLVSLPFSDHSAVLITSPADFREILNILQEDVDGQDCEYIEIRPTSVPDSNLLRFHESSQFYWHKLSLDKSLDTIFGAFHKSCVQRKIMRAFREKLEYTEGRSEKLIQQFYHLLLLTRHRHQLPPAPITWFRNLADCLGETLKVRIASKDGRPIAGMITLSYKESAIYKYGCSEAEYHNLGGMAFLFWKTIQEAKSCGCKELDMGRSDCDNIGLVNFKEHWGATRSVLTYWRYPTSMLLANGERWEIKAAKRVFALAPAVTLSAAGRLLYRHIG
jgi:CelD/BcsL family acetyltransferase involved in cellulose biosynthesis